MLAMSDMSGDSLRVLRGFIASANAQMRAAGLGEHQMHVAKSGVVTSPTAAKAKRTAAAAPNSSSRQAKAGASAISAPQVTGVQQGGTDSFR
ncbi:MAG: hypothetical protein JWN41_914, partial [Thermoleophilia bacterium]|nr:hypothetical protein [Thermoleophilia bacterium]